MIVASIDVGIVNLAVVFAEVHDVTFNISRIVRVENVNSTIMEHNVVARENCVLGHAKTAADRVTHFVQERQSLFDSCGVILIERQPIMGHTDVEQVLFLLFRTRAELVSPNAMHSFFNISGYTYEGRKQKTTIIADHYLSSADFPEYYVLERRHDIADAICLLFFWIHVQKRKHETTKATAKEVYPQKVVSGNGNGNADADADTVVDVFKANISRFSFKRKSGAGAHANNSA